MAETQLPEWPKWFIKFYQFNPANEGIDKKKWRIKTLIATVWLLLAAASMTTSAKHKVARIIFSFGYEYLGEYVFKVGNLMLVILMLQFLVCQLIQYRSLRASNLTSHTVCQPLRSTGTGKQLKHEVGLVMMCNMFIRAWCLGFAIFSAFSLHGSWYVLIYKVAIGCIGGYAGAAASCLMICNCLFLNRTCQALICKITALNDLLVVDQRRKSRLIPVTTICYEFQSICVELHNHNLYWKKVILVITSTVLPMIVSATFVVIGMKSELLNALGIAIVFLMLVGTSLFYLTPAKVESKLRKCYPLMCQLLRYRSINWTLKLKLLRLVKQFDNQISFTSWDTNKINYMDYNEVGFSICMVFLDGI